MLLKSYIVLGSLICLTFAVGAARGWSAPGAGMFQSSGSGTSSSGGSGGGGIIWGGGGGRWSSGSGGWGGGK